MCKLEGCIPFCAMKVLAGIFAPAADQLADRGSSWSISIGLGGGRWVVWSCLCVWMDGWMDRVTASDPTRAYKPWRTVSGKMLLRDPS